MVFNRLEFYKSSPSNIDHKIMKLTEFTKNIVNQQLLVKFTADIKRLSTQKNLIVMVIDN
jgi:hypothetical protein